MCFLCQEEVVAASLEKRRTAADEKSALGLAEELANVAPPILAYVPDLWPDGTQKDLRGWQVRVVLYVKTRGNSMWRRL